MARAATGAVFIFFCLLAFFMFQAFQKEQALQEIKAKVHATAEEVQKKEEQIVQAKLRIQELNAVLLPSNAKKDDLLHKKNELSNRVKEVAKDLETCQTQKTEVDKKKEAATEIIKKLKVDQEKEKTDTENQIQQLKQQILDRDKKVCQFVDKQQEEGRKACEALAAQK